MDSWTWRERIAYRIHQLAYRFAPPVEQDVVVRDGAGDEVFSIAFCGGFVASGPIEPYKVYSRSYANEDDLVGTEVEW